jgi:hypothetical protein
MNIDANLVTGFELGFATGVIAGMVFIIVSILIVKRLERDDSLPKQGKRL